jgi:hypothetical protein
LRRLKGTLHLNFKHTVPHADWHIRADMVGAEVSEPQGLVLNMRIMFAISSLCLLLGCVGAEITTPPITITPKDRAGAVGVDVYAKARSQGNPVPRFRGQKTVSIRTRGKGESSQTELRGVPCTLDSGVYAAQFTTPANLVVPDYGPNSPALFVRCETETQSGSITVNAYNDTSRQRQASAAGTGLLGAIVIGAVAAANTNNETDDFKYPAITINLRDK